MKISELGKDLSAFSETVNDLDYLGAKADKSLQDIVLFLR